jgi:hypothetical protein
MVGLAILSALPCKICGKRPVWHTQMRNTLRCPPSQTFTPIDEGEAPCDVPLTRSTQDVAVKDWNERQICRGPSDG